jgi:hypothetical protein
MQDRAQYDAIWSKLLADDPLAADHAAAVAAEAARLVSSSGPVRLPRQMTRARQQPPDAGVAPISSQAPGPLPALWASQLATSAGAALAAIRLRAGRVAKRGGFKAGAVLDLERWAEGTDGELPLKNLDQLFAQVCMPVVLLAYTYIYIYIYI